MSHEETINNPREEKDRNLASDERVSSVVQLKSSPLKQYITLIQGYEWLYHAWYTEVDITFDINSIA
ncbi:MAG: hypothetical protein NVSMB49_00910 [Ktedonobacteraceae bacterium]